MFTKNNILIAYAAVILGIILFPPFNYAFANGSIRNLGYSFIFEPPKIGYSYSSKVGSVDVSLLLVEMLAASLVFAVLYLIVSNKEKTE